jgi:hypothetical protein
LAPHGAATALVERCHAAEVAGTRQGILLAFAFTLWGAFHYLLASFGLERRLAQLPPLAADV